MAAAVFGGSHSGSVHGWWSLWHRWWVCGWWVCGVGGGFVGGGSVGGEFVAVVVWLIDLWWR